MLGAMSPRTQRTHPFAGFQDLKEAPRHARWIVGRLVRENNPAGRPTVLGLATGSPPAPIANHSAKNKDEGLDLPA